MGGGGFSMEPDNPLLDDTSSTSPARTRGRDRPRVCFLRDGERRRGRLRRELLRRVRAPERGQPPRPVRPDGRPTSRRSCSTRTSSTSAAATPRTCSPSGGSTASTARCERAWEAGVVLAGLSAGSMCWFESGTTDSFGPTSRRSTAGSGSWPGSHCPHYDGEAAAAADLPAADRARDACPPGYAADDGAALVFRDGELEEVVASRPAARGYRVEPGPDGTADRDRAADALPRLKRARVAIAAPTRVPRRRRRGPHRRPSIAGLPAPRGLDGLAPAGRHQPRRQVGERREDEQAPPRPRDAGPRAASRPWRGIGVGVERSAPRAAARSRGGRGRRRAGRGRARADPSDAAALPPERALEVLELREERRARRSPGPGRPGTSSATTALRNSGWSVTPDRRRRIEPRDAAEACAGQVAERRHRARPASPSASPTFAPRPM